MAVSRICTICARGGSKGLKNKNVMPLKGRPLIAHSVIQALATKLFDVIAVSSDSPEILAAAQAAGAQLLIKRPDEMATDTAAKVPAIKHCLLESERLTKRTFDVLVDLDATSPLRTPQDVIDVVEMLEAGDASNVITACPARRSPYFNLVEVGADNVVRLSKPPASAIVRRQDSPDCYDMNASIYAWWRQILIDEPRVFLDKTRLHVMPRERSIDIDDDVDFLVVETLMTKAMA